jgi:23S rRNA pseudouridine1911/1915/1917 synthase
VIADAAPGTIALCVAVVDPGRLDAFLADQLAISRTQAARLIADGRVTLDGRPLRAAARLPPRSEVHVVFPAAAPPRTYAPAHGALRFVYEDEDLAVLDKPAGLVVHPSPGHWEDSLVNRLVGQGTALAPAGGTGRPGIVHRLDRDTSGLLVLAKTDTAHRRLARAIEQRRVRRVYATLAWGHLPQPTVDIDAPVARHPQDRKRMVVRAGGRHALSHVAVVARFAHVELLRVRLATGRTHQIRVHLAHVGHPVVGDREYSSGGARRVTPSARREAERIEALTPRQALHAAELAFTHPVTGVPLRLRAEWPDDLRPALAEAGRDPDLLAERNSLQYLGFWSSDG